MVNRDTLIKFIYSTIGSELLDKVQTFDSRANGIQVLGTDKVNKIALGVSASLDFFKEAVAAKADFCIFHHGLSLSEKDIVNSLLDSATQKRLRFVFEHQLTVAGFHASLDIHPQIGNSALIINKLGARRLDAPYCESWGWVAEFDAAQNVNNLADKCAKIFSHDVFAVYSGPKVIKRIGVCSGSGKPMGESVFEIMDKGIQLHISGEISEGGPALAKDMGFNYFACGHYATEVFGIQELGKVIKSHFKDQIEVEFIDIPNPI